jgi:c-di-AMP phosphodiesterase-like protein
MDIKNLKLNIEQKVLGKKRVVIVPHKRIDFDAIGSALGLAVIVRKMNAVPIIVVDDNIKEMQRGIQIIMDDVSKDFEIVSRDKYLEMKDDDDVYILTDVNKRGMVSIEDTIHDPERTIIIDHHNMDDTTIESDATYVDEYVSSASEIVARLMCMFKCKSTPEIANYLLAGIYLDTNHMSKNVSNDTFFALPVNTIINVYEISPNPIPCPIEPVIGIDISISATGAS